MFLLAGADHVITVGLHAAQIQGFCVIPVSDSHIEPREYCRPEELSSLPPKQETVSFMDRLNVAFALQHRERRRTMEMDEMILVGD